MTRNKLLPAGVTVRQFQMEDGQAVVDMFNRWSQALLGQNMEDLEEMSAFWKSNQIVLGKDAILAQASDGQVIGYAEMPSNIPPFARMYAYARVDPDWWGRGIGRFLLRWAEQQGRENIHRAEADIRVVAAQHVLENDAGANALMVSEGYTHLRTSWLMEIGLDDDIPAPVLPEGVRIRGIQPVEEEYRRLFRTAQEAFRDHYGFVDLPFEQYYETHMHYVKNEEHHPELYLVAEKAGEVIGCSLCTPKSSIDEKMGWVNTLGVLREHRGGGVGSGLLKESFRALKRFGNTRAGLGVDSGSLTGAVRIYQRAGMKVMSAFNLYEKELRPGREIIKRSLDE